jgi:hypothetical protein
MIGAIEHVSRHQVSGGELQVVADAEKGVEELVEAEKRVASGFLRHGGWPHKRVNLYVFQSLQPLAERLLRLRRLSDESARRLDHAPMVHVYDEDDLDECSVYCNRSLMLLHGLWEDAAALEGLLAREHARPLAMNAMARAARGLTARLVSIDVAARRPGPAARAGAIGYARLVRPGPAVRRLIHDSLLNLARELCVKAPREVFSSEHAVRAGFGPSLLRLSLLGLAQGRSGMVERAALVSELRSEVDERRLSEREMALLLLAASAEAHLRTAIETAAFARAGCLNEASAVEELAEARVFRRVEPETGALYRKLYESYLALTPTADAEAARDWASAAFLPLIQAFAGRGAAFAAEFHHPRQPA